MVPIEIAAVVDRLRDHIRVRGHLGGSWGEEGCLSRGMEYLNKDIGRRKLV
jgi:hypothetical protein